MRPYIFFLVSITSLTCNKTSVTVHDRGLRQPHPYPWFWQFMAIFIALLKLVQLRWASGNISVLKHDSASGKLDLVKRTLMTPHLEGEDAHR